MKAIKRFLIFVSVLIVLVAGYIVFNQFQEKIYINNVTSTIIKKIQLINKLETTELTITKIVESGKEMNDLFPKYNWDNKIQDFLFEDKLVMEIEGKVIAGINLEGWNIAEKVKQNGNNFLIELPEPEILQTFLTENSNVFDRKLGLFTKGDEKLESEIRTKIIEEIKNEAITEGILEKAKKDVETNIKSSFDLENTNINFIFSGEKNI